jgi:hypothetical protein
MPPGSPTPDRREGEPTETVRGTQAGDGNPAKDDARRAVERGKEEAKRTGEDVKHRAEERAEAGRREAASQADALSHAMESAASTLRDEDKEALSEIARRAGDSLGTLANRLHDRSIDDLVRDARRLARDNPSLFMMGSIALGFGLSRFWKASGGDLPHETAFRESSGEPRWREGEATHTEAAHTTSYSGEPGGLSTPSAGEPSGRIR